MQLYVIAVLVYYFRANLIWLLLLLLFIFMLYVDMGMLNFTLDLQKVKIQVGCSDSEVITMCDCVLYILLTEMYGH